MIKNSNSYFKVIHQNIRSISANLDDFLATIHRSKTEWDLMVFTECWLPKTHSIPQIENYRHFKTNNNLTQNEGVVVYLKKTLNVQIDEPTISECNCISIQINMDTIVVAIYRPYGYSSPTKFI